MGMKLFWKDVTPVALAALLRDPERVDDFIGANPSYRRAERGQISSTCSAELLDEWRTPVLSLGPDGKRWIGVEYFLRRSGETSHLGKELIKGGTPFGPELGYGRARYRTPEELASLVRDLPSPEEVADRFGAGDHPFPSDGRTEWEEARDARLAEAWRQEDTAEAVADYRAILEYHRQATQASHAMLSYFV